VTSPRDDDAPAEDDGASVPGPPAHLAGLKGMDLVRRALEEARGAARDQGKDVGRGRRSPAPRRAAPRSTRRRWSGPGPDSRDPQLLGAATDALSTSRGWKGKVAEGAVFGRWRRAQQQKVDHNNVNADWDEQTNSVVPAEVRETPKPTASV
jgi:predicted nucleic acid-binding Zn ribbon protein